MFDTAPNASSQRNFGRSARLVLTAAAFTLLAGGTALATASTSSGTDTHQGPAAQSLLHADSSNITETAEAPEAVDPVDPAGAAQGVHGACVSKVAQDTTTVGRAHGLAVSKAAHDCPKGSDTAAGAAKGAEKSSAAQAKRAAKSAARTARGKS
jgi:hypothetical protein